MSDERIVILAHEKFPDRAKTALGVMRYGDQDVQAVLDRERAGDRVVDHVPDISRTRRSSTRSRKRTRQPTATSTPYISVSRRSAAASTSRGATTSRRRSKPVVTW